MTEKLPGEKPARTGTASGAESPTTARPLDFDDELGETPAAVDSTISPPPPSKSPKPGVRFQEETSEIPPPKPPRPMNPQVQAENTLIEAFPDIDSKVVKAVLLASGGKVEPAFNALLSMSDPNYKGDEAPPLQPPRPITREPRNQLEADELYARQLAEHYNSSGGHGTRGNPRHPQQRTQTGLKPNELYDDNHSFFEDDFPKIKEEFRKGFIETQSKVNKWITDFKKKLDGDEDDDFHGEGSQQQGQRRDFGPSQSDQLYGIRKSSEQARRSADRERYDTDNRVLGDDFEALELRDDEAPPQQPPRSTRPLANPDLFKPTPVSPPQNRGHPIDEVDALYRNPSPSNNSATKSSGKKWQPLTSVAPHPEPDEHDPFSLGDSDDEENKTKDIKAEDTERLKKAAEGKTDVGGTGTLGEHERSGSLGQKDAVAEELLKESK